MNMAGREEQLLAIRIGETLARAADAERHYVTIIEASNSEQLEDPDNDEFHDAAELLAHRVRTAFRECQMLAERLHMPDFAKDIRKKLKSYGGDAKLTSTRYNSAAGEQYCPAVADAWSFYESMAAVALGGAVTGLSVLETILRNTAKIIEQAKITPDRETQVRDAVFEILKLAFLDARKEAAIAKSFKTYKPDIGVPALFAAVEYKYLRTKEDMKNHLDQVFADMRGYGGHPDWRNFYAVLYQQGAFYTQEDVAEIFRESGVSSNWIPIVLNGPGE
jgi:REase_DpnII-MboI